MIWRANITHAGFNQESRHMRQAMKDRRDMDIEKGRTSSGFNSVTGPNITQLRTWARNSLESRDLGVLQGGCKSDHARYVAGVGDKDVIGQAAN